MKEKDKLTEQDLEAFKEMGNIGAGHAAIALTKLFKREVDMSVPYVVMGDQDEILEEANLTEEQTLGYEIVDINEPLKYRLSVLFKANIMIKIVNLLSSTSRKTISGPKDLSEMQKSLIQEIGSTIMLRYIAALNKMLKVDSLPNVAPVFKMDPPRDVINKIGYVENENDSILLIQLDLFTAESKFECQMFIQPHTQSLEKFRKSLFG